MDLNLLLAIPLCTLVAILFCKGSKARSVALFGAIIQLVFSGILLYVYLIEKQRGNSSIIFFEQTYSWFSPLHINYHIGVDGISIAMILLTAFIVLAGVLVSWRSDRMSKEFFFLLTLLATGAYGFFISLDLFTLFFFLEIAVIPKFLLIGIWGTGKKEYSATKLVLMLMAGSALVFVGLMGIYFSQAEGTQSFDLLTVSTSKLSLNRQLIFFPFAFIGFGIFGALFPFHTWVPDGHSSAPTAASMFLAGISMKLGGYGCLRVAAFLMPDAAHYYSPLIVILSAIAILYGAFATMMQTDLKYINAYSSISHCGFVLLGIGMLTQTSISGAVMQMVSHGLMTALFFACIGMIYERGHTREVKNLGGLLKVMPFISTAFVIVALCSLGLPGLSGFAAEVTVFIGSWQQANLIYRLCTIVACASIVVTAVYILRAVASVIMGPIKNPAFNGLKDAQWNEIFAMVLLLAGIFGIGLAPFWLADLVSPGAAFIARALGY